jgi:hypothetical protein
MPSFFHKTSQRPEFARWLWGSFEGLGHLNAASCLCAPRILQRALPDNRRFA